VVAFLWGIRKKIVRDEIKEQRTGVSTLTEYSTSWNQILLLVGPFAVAYFALLIPRSTTYLIDRYLLAFTFLFALCLIRTFQNFVQPNLPAVTKGLVVVIAIYSIGATHDMFAFYRARIAVANEVLAAGVQPNTFDGGYEYNAWIELVNGGHVNDEKILNPPNSYLSIDPYRGWGCDGGEKIDEFNIKLPHFFPRYGLSFLPDACAGRSSFAPVSYFRWLGLRAASLYVVNYQPRESH
jgi:hypothetical protein